MNIPRENGIIHGALNSGIEVAGVNFPFSAIFGAAATLHFATKANGIEEEIKNRDRVTRVVRNSSMAVVNEIRRRNQIEAPKKRERFVVQKVVLRKDHFDDFDDASDWIELNGFENHGVISKPNAWHFKQRDKSYFQRTRSKRASPSVSLVGGPLR
jgi:hypothetical protein